MRYQLVRFGAPYACWGSSEAEVWLRLRETDRRAIWWLKLLGWSVRQVADQ